MREFTLKILVAMFSAISVAGCADQGRIPTVAANTSLASNEEVDYTGHLCANQYLHVKSPLCVFPRPE
jgi:uncharacterized lipoprotein YajG